MGDFTEIVSKHRIIPWGVFVFFVVIWASNALATTQHRSSVVCREAPIDSRHDQISNGDPENADIYYSYWSRGCDGYISFIDGQTGARWGAELQNGAGLDKSSVACACIDRSTNTETDRKYLVWNGQTCECSDGEEIQLQIDGDTCRGYEVATGTMYQVNET
jgi:hypothetical protein